MGNAKFFADHLKVFVERTLSPQAQSAFLAKAAKERLAVLIASGQALPNYRCFVDGREGVPEESVRPANAGLIMYRFQNLGRVAVFALTFLVKRSPERSGRFRKSFYLRLMGDTGRGRVVMMEEFNAQKLGADVTKIEIGNVQPYSRKVDVQLVGNRRLHFSVPPGLFANCAAAIMAQFDDIVDVKRVNTKSFAGQYKLRSLQFRKGKAKPRKKVDSPAIVIALRRR